jgi:hypothetical protein
LKFILFFLPLAATAQWLTVGVTGGVPVSSHTTTYPASPNGPNDLYQKPYAVGPAIEVKLPLNLSVEAGILYQRFHMNSSEGITPIKGTGSANFGFTQNLAANAWLFPLLVKYNIGHHSLTPFVEAGATLRHLGVFNGAGIQYDFFLHPNPATFTFDPGKALDVAVTAGAGVRFHAWLVDVAPEIRYLHWTAAYEQPAQDQAMLMLTVSFPGRK